MQVLRVLIAEADELLQKLYSDLILNEEFFVIEKCVSSGPEMFEAMESADIDLVLLDMYLDDFSALEGLDKLRREFPRTDYIIASSGEDPDLVRKALCQGVFEYLIKPFPFERLRTALRNYRVYHHSLTGRTRPWRQEDIDALIAMKSRDPNRTDRRAVPKGLQLKSLNDIESYLRDNDDSFSAQEVADALGLSRSTARRYLEFLSMSGRVEIEYAYKKVGRPEKRYRFAIF